MIVKQAAVARKKGGLKTRKLQVPGGLRINPSAIHLLLRRTLILKTRIDNLKSE